MSPTVTRIITGGVVTAPGYDPIVITNVAQAEEAVGGVFIPDIPIMQVNTTYVNHLNQTVDREQILEQLSMYDRDADFLHKTVIFENNDTAVMIVIVACAAIVLLVLVLTARFFWRKLRVE